MKRIWIYESELRAIAQETLAWESETGGDLFGIWEPEPIVFLATRMGPDSKRSKSQCQFDLPYLERLSIFLASEWSLNYFGDWHSHYLSQVDVPSRTDRNRIGRLLERLGFPRIIEFITNVSDGPPDVIRNVRIHGFDFPRDTWYSPDALTVSVVPGISPVRDALSRRREFLEQQWTGWTAVRMEMISGSETVLASEAELLSLHQSFRSRLPDGTVS